MVFTYRKHPYTQGDPEEKSNVKYRKEQLASAFSLQPDSIRIKRPDGVADDIDAAEDNIIYSVHGSPATQNATAELPSKIDQIFNNYPKRKLDIPIKNRDQARGILVNLVLHNWKKRDSTMIQQHKLGYICGQSGIGKTTLLTILHQDVWTHVKSASLAQADAQEEYEELLLALKTAVHVYVDLNNGDQIQQDDKTPRNIVGSRVFSHVAHGQTWGSRGCTQIQSSSCSPEAVFRLIGEHLMARGDHWRIFYLFFDECQNITKTEDYLRQFTGGISSLLGNNSGEDTIAHRYKLCLVPIYAGTVPRDQIESFGTISGLDPTPISINLLDSDQAFNAFASKVSFRHHMLEDRKMKLVVKFHCILPRALQILLEIFNDPNHPDGNATYWERSLREELRDVYKSTTVLSSMGESGRVLTLAALTNSSTVSLRHNDQFIKDLRNAVHRGCIQINDDSRLSIPHFLFEMLITKFMIPFDLPAVTKDITWQDFETTIAQYQALRVEFYGCTIESILPGAIVKAGTQLPVLSCPNMGLIKDDYHSVHHSQYIPPLERPEGVSLCLTGNPAFDIRMTFRDQHGQRYLVWEQLRHGALNAKSSTSVNWNMIHSWYEDASRVQRDITQFPNPPFLVYITNKSADKNSNLKQNVPQNLAIITRDEFHKFFPPLLHQIALDTQ